MKNLMLLFSFSVLITFAGCNECKYIQCNEDEKLLKCIDDLLPYQKGNTLKFVSETNDTVVFTCTDREYFNEPGFYFDIKQSTCCGSYSIENLRCSFSPSGDTSLSFRTDNSYHFGNISISISIGNQKLFGFWFIENDCSNAFSSSNGDSISVKLVGQNFHGVYLPDSGDSTIYLEPTSVGLVGFKLAGKEWRKL